MGVYMPTVEMPTNCTECKLRLIVGCNPYKDNGLSPSKERHKDCPLVEIKTPHGRLIDEDTIGGVFIDIEVSGAIEDAPTVIEVEVE